MNDRTSVLVLSVAMISFRFVPNVYTHGRDQASAQME